MTVASIHNDLDYDRWAPTLRGVGGIWSKLEALRAKATDPVGLTTYRAYLQRCVNQLKTDAELDEPGFTTVIKAWADYTKERNAALQARIQARMPLGVENWMHKWQPLVYDTYRLALDAWLTRATTRSGVHLLDATRELFDEFEKAVPCESE